jgi:hypothetical protein
MKSVMCRQEFDKNTDGKANGWREVSLLNAPTSVLYTTAPSEENEILDALDYLFWDLRR